MGCINIFGGFKDVLVSKSHRCLFILLKININKFFKKNIRDMKRFLYWGLHEKRSFVRRFYRGGIE